MTDEQQKTDDEEPVFAISWLPKSENKKLKRDYVAFVSAGNAEDAERQLRESQKKKKGPIVIFWVAKIEWIDFKGVEFAKIEWVDFKGVE